LLLQVVRPPRTPEYAAHREETGSNSLWHLQRLTGKALLTINPDQALGDCDADGVQPVPGAEFALGIHEVNFDFPVGRIQFVADFDGPKTIGSALQAGDFHARQFDVVLAWTRSHASVVHHHTVQVHARARPPPSFFRGGSVLLLPT
jgi:hypothetical protein